MPQFPETELILTNDHRVYHLQLKNEDIADDVIVVGDQNRVGEISKHFSKIEFKTAHREFFTHTGIFKNKRITVISTGIGTDNMDIVLNELDAAVNIDPGTRNLKPNRRSLNIYRLGTSGALQHDLSIDSFIASSHGLGFDGLLPFYKGWEKENKQSLCDAFIKHLHWPKELATPYCYEANGSLLEKFIKTTRTGITATAPGFYGPQGRHLRVEPSVKNLNELLASFQFNTLQITNFEMETSALYGLGKLLGHSCLTICVIIANRVTKEFTTDYKRSVDTLIEFCLNKISE
jgi:uridine phosphorylase